MSERSGTLCRADYIGFNICLTREAKMIKEVFILLVMVASYHAVRVPAEKRDVKIPKSEAQNFLKREKRWLPNRWTKEKLREECCVESCSYEEVRETGGDSGFTYLCWKQQNGVSCFWDAPCPAWAKSLYDRIMG